MRDIVESFKALSDENRLKILQHLSCGELCACDIKASLDLTQPTISHHMRVLQQAGIVASEKRGKWTFYSINETKLGKIKQFINSMTSEITECKYKSDCDCDGERR